MDPNDRHPDCLTLAQELMQLIPGCDQPATDLGQMVAEDSDVIARSNYAPATQVDELGADFEATEIYARRSAPPPVPPASILPRSLEDTDTPMHIDPDQGATQVATRVTTVSEPELQSATRADDMPGPATRVGIGVATKVSGHIERLPGHSCDLYPYTVRGPKHLLSSEEAVAHAADTPARARDRSG